MFDRLEVIAKQVSKKSYSVGNEWRNIFTIRAVSLGTIRAYIWCRRAYCTPTPYIGVHTLHIGVLTNHRLTNFQSEHIYSPTPPIDGAGLK